MQDLPQFGLFTGGQRESVHSRVLVYSKPCNQNTIYTTLHSHGNTTTEIEKIQQDQGKDGTISSNFEDQGVQAMGDQEEEEEKGLIKHPDKLTVYLD